MELQTSLLWMYLVICGFLSWCAWECSANNGACVTRMIKGRLQKIGDCDTSNTLSNMIEHLDPFKATNGLSYTFNPERKSAIEAARSCAIIDAYLVAEGFRNATVRGELVSSLIPAEGVFSIFIGLQAYNDTHWVWADGVLSATASIDWHKDEPNNFKGVQEDCVETSKNKNYLLNDIPCSAAFAYICESRHKSSL